MERYLPETDRPQIGLSPEIRTRTMQENLGPRFPKAVSDLVSWFEQVEKDLDPEKVRIVVEEILAENGNMSDLALQTLIRERYAKKIDALVQAPAISLNPQDAENFKTVTKFKFAPLTGDSDIRLLKFRKFIVLGGQTYFSCELVHANLDDHPNYTALSYVWGPLDDGYPVLVGDDEFLMVTRNLMEVLYRFSGANSPTDTGNTTTLLWMDQLCINQYDHAERSKQVALMRRIYSQAYETKLWLGEEDDNAIQAFELIRSFECISTIELNQMLLLLGKKELDAEENHKRFFERFPQAIGRIPPVSDPKWKALFQLLDRSWFSRMWVFQEAILSFKKAKVSVVCGQMVCDFVHLYFAKSLIYVDWDVESLPPGYKMVEKLMVYYLYQKIGTFPHIVFTVWQIGGCLHSRDPRDRIFGLLGIQDRGLDIGFPIDYTKSVQDTYIDFTRLSIERGQGLRVLELIKESKIKEMEPKQWHWWEIEESPIEEPQVQESQVEEITAEGILDLPSWVPDWSVEGATIPLGGSNIAFALTSRFNASGSLRYIPSPELESRGRLVVKGKIIDHIEREMEHDFQIGTPLQIEQYFSINFRVRLWVMFIERCIEIGLVEKATTEQLQAAIMRTITADGFNNSIAFPERRETVAGRLSDEDAVERYHELERLRELSVNGLPLPQEWSAAKKDMHRQIWINTEVCKGRRLAVLEKHWVMLGPKNARQWDHIVVINGSPVPWVLRSVDMVEGTFKVVGQCFVDGVMYGETVDWNEDDAETFLLV